jgi:hypothetical protein
VDARVFVKSRENLCVHPGNSRWGFKKTFSVWILSNRDQYFANRSLDAFVIDRSRVPPALLRVRGRALFCHCFLSFVVDPSGTRCFIASCGSLSLLIFRVACHQPLAANHNPFSRFEIPKKQYWLLLLGDPPMQIQVLIPQPFQAAVS